MKRLQLLKNITLFFIVSAILFSFVYKANAQEETTDTQTTQGSQEDDAGFISRADWGADESLVINPIDSFSQPTRFVYVDLVPDQEYANSESYVKELYYFLTFKMGLGDIPFHYLQDGEGNIYEGNSSGFDAILPIKGFEKGDVVIGYIGDSAKDLNSDNFKKGMEEIVGKVKLAPKNLTVENADLKIDLENQNSSLEFTVAAKDDVFATAINSAKGSLNDITVPEKKYALEFVGVQYNKDPEANSTIEVDLELKNTGEDNFYLGGDSELYIATNDPFDSKGLFYINGDWANESRIALMNNEHSVLRKGDRELFKFNIKVPLASGEQKESFIVVDKKGDKFDTSKFDVAFVLKLGDLKVLEIKETETGFLRVRESASGFSKEVAKVLSGERYEYLQRSETGWYEIKYSGDKKGWVSSQYVNVISFGSD